MDQIQNQKRFSTLEMAHVQVYGRMGNLVSKLKNVSSSGAFLELTQGEYVPQQGDIIHVTVHLHSINRSRAFDAEVKWNDGLGFGVHFIKKDQLVEKMMTKNAI
jgi:hypothetical protein